MSGRRSKWLRRLARQLSHVGGEAGRDALYRRMKHDWPRMPISSRRAVAAHCGDLRGA